MHIPGAHPRRQRALSLHIVVSTLKRGLKENMRPMELSTPRSTWSIRSWSWPRDDDEVEAKLIVVGIET